MIKINSTRPLRVLLVTYTLGRGGAEQSIVNLVPALLEEGVEVEVASLDPPYDLAESIETCGARVHRMTLHHRWSLPEGIAKLVALVKRGKFDVIQCYDFVGSLYGTLAKPWIGQTAVIASFQGLEFDRDQLSNPWQKARRKFRLFLLRRQMDRGVAISQSVLAHYRKHLGRNDLSVIYNPFPPRIFEWGAGADRAALNLRFGLESHDFVIFMVGRLIPEKAHATVVKALRILRDETGLSPKLICFGKGPLEAAVRDAIRAAGLEKNVQIFDPLPHAELFPLVAAGDLFIQPSVSEGFGQAIGEAMALGLPVIATRVGGIPELVDDGATGVLIPPSDAPALADALAKLIRSPDERARLGAAGSARMKSAFSAAQIARRWIALYQEILSALA